MNHEPTEHDELLQRFSRYADGKLTAHEVELLERQLQSDAAILEQFVLYMELHARLTWAARARGDADHRPTTSYATLPRLAFDLLNRPTPFSFTVATVVILLLVATMALMVPPFYRAIAHRGGNDQLDANLVVAQLTALHEVVWADEQSAADEGTFITAGRVLELKSGMARIKFDSGAEMIVEGPARFTMASENAAELDFGRVTAHVPEAAIGYTLTTPTASVVDLGTEFHLAVDRRGNENVYVFDGVVRVANNDSQTSRGSQEVRAGQAVAWTADGSAKPTATLPGERFAVLAGRLNPDTTVLLYDNFNAVDTGSFDRAPLAGRLGGLLADEVVLRSARKQQQIADNRLQMVRAAAGSGRIRFQPADQPGWYDWAAGSAATTILDADTLRIDFVWTAPDTTSNDWISLSIGHADPSQGEPVMRVTNRETDYGILLRGNGGTQRFDNGKPTSKSTFTPTTNRQHVVIELQFDSFADGSEVDVTVKVAGQQVDHHTFTWDNNDGQLYLELGTLQTGMLIDNFRLVAIGAVADHSRLRQINTSALTRQLEPISTSLPFSVLENLL